MNETLERAIRKKLYKPTGELTQADLEKVTELDLRNNQLTEVPKGLENLTQLTELNLSDNKLTDITALKDLTQLKSLDLSDNTKVGSDLADMTPLKNLTKLTSLDLGNNAIEDVAPLNNLTQLQSLDLRDNCFPDITPLKDLINLKFLWVDQITDHECSMLENLVCLESLVILNQETGINLSPLLNHPRLKELNLDTPVSKLEGDGYGGFRAY